MNFSLAMCVSVCLIAKLRDAKRNDAVLGDIRLARREVHTTSVWQVRWQKLRVVQPCSINFFQTIKQAFLPSTPDKKFEERLMAWLIGLISGVLCLEC